MISENPDIDVVDQWLKYMHLYAQPIIASGLSIVPVHGCFVRKNAWQSDKIPPPIFADATIRTMPGRVYKGLRKGCHSAPIVGALVGTQMIAQKAFENFFWPVPKGKENEFTWENGLRMISSSSFVGICGTPFLVIFNGLTTTPRISPKEALRRMTFPQTIASVGIETSFLFGMRFGKPVAQQIYQWMSTHQIFEEKMRQKIADIVGNFTSGALTAAIGYPYDTALKRLQDGMPCKLSTFTTRCFAGVLWKMGAIGGFSVTYQLLNEALNPITASI